VSRVPIRLPCARPRSEQAEHVVMPARITSQTTSGL
jgi:hypothetical protein